MEADKSSKMDFLLFNYDSSFSTIVHKTNSLFFSENKMNRVIMLKIIVYLIN